MEGEARQPSSNPIHRGLRVIAMLVAMCILPLVMVGAGVTTKQAGMAYADWPTSDGHILNPPGWTNNDKTFFEHGHRLLGWTVGILAIASAVMCWSAGGSLRILGLATLLAICIQGVLGGIRVRANSTPLAMVHGIWAQICFALACLVVLLASPELRRIGNAAPVRGLHFFRRLCLAGVLATFLQLVFGAAYRHFGNTHALIAHLLWAVALIVLLSWIAIWTLEQYSSYGLLLKFGRALAALIGVQMLLGGLAFLVVVMGAQVGDTLRWMIPAGHVLAGAMILACMAALTVCSFQILAAPRLAKISADGWAVTS